MKNRTEFTTSTVWWLVGDRELWDLENIYCI